MAPVVPSPIDQRQSAAVQAAVNLQEVRDREITAPSLCSLAYFCLALWLGISFVLVFYYLKSIKPYVFLPADILMWAETNFVGDIIKLRIGVPIYTPAADSNSLIYTPGAPLLTYAISWIIGMPTSIVAWRVIQLAYIVCAAIVATVSCRALHEFAYPNHRVAFPKTWYTFTFLAMCLVATAPTTNPFAHTLHADALALFISMISFWSILRYLSSPSYRNLVVMAICPAVGYLTKQFLLSWSVVMFVFLLLRSPKDVKTLIFFAIVTTTSILAAIGLCYWLWGDPFFFWTFEVMGGTRKALGLSPSGNYISLTRSLEHLVRVWLEIAIGIFGGWLILREHNMRKLGPLWAGWLVLIATEAFSSGAGWGVLYHFGPGVLIGAVWMFAALARLWPSTIPSTDAEFPRIVAWTQPLAAAGAVLTIFATLHVLPTAEQYEARYWQRRPSPDVHRYISDIEREFDGLPIEKVLLDVGNWIYLRHSFLAKDRAISLGDQPVAGIYQNFEVLLEQIRTKVYDKILVRDFHSPFFLYDWEGWPTSSGVRQTLLEYYTEVRTIPAPKGDNLLPPMIMHTGPVSVLVPKPGLNSASTGDRS